LQLRGLNDHHADEVSVVVGYSTLLASKIMAWSNPT